MPDQARHDEAAEDEPGPLEFRPPKTTFRLMQGEDEILTVTLQNSAAGLRLDRALAEALPALSRERLKTLIKGGRVADARGTVLWDPSAQATAPATIQVPLPTASPPPTAPPHT